MHQDLKMEEATRDISHAGLIICCVLICISFAGKIASFPSQCYLSYSRNPQTIYSPRKGRTERESERDKNTRSEGWTGITQPSAKLLFRDCEKMTKGHRDHSALESINLMWMPIVRTSALCKWILEHEIDARWMEWDKNEIRCCQRVLRCRFIERSPCLFTQQVRGDSRTCCRYRRVVFSVWFYWHLLAYTCR